MVGAEDPVEQEFAFLLGLSPQRLSARARHRAGGRAGGGAALRARPTSVRPTSRTARPANDRRWRRALASPKALSKEHLLDVAATLRARAADQAHLDAGETGDIDLAVELIEERPPAEQAEMLEAMRRADPAKARAVQAALINDQSFERVSDEVLTAAAMAVPTEVPGALPARRPGGGRDAARCRRCRARSPRRSRKICRWTWRRRRSRSSRRGARCSHRCARRCGTVVSRRRACAIAGGSR